MIAYYVFLYTYIFLFFLKCLLAISQGGGVFESVGECSRAAQSHKEFWSVSPSCISFYNKI